MPAFEGQLTVVDQGHCQHQTQQQRQGQQQRQTNAPAAIFSIGNDAVVVEAKAAGLPQVKAEKATAGDQYHQTQT